MRMTDADPVLYHEAWKKLCECEGVLVPGGFGKRGVEGKIAATQWARHVFNKPQKNVQRLRESCLSTKPVTKLICSRSTCIILTINPFKSLAQKMFLKVERSVQSLLALTHWKVLVHRGMAP